MKIYYRLIKIISAIFIIFSIMTVEGYSYGSSSSGGSGARGMAPANIDPFGNIVKYEVRDGDLIYNQSVEYAFNAPELSIYKILVNGKENEFGVSVRVEDLRNTSKYAKPAPGIVYRNENVWIGSKRLNYITIKFKVKNSWMEENGLNDTRHPYLLKWNGTAWLALKTNTTGKDGLYTYFEAPKAGSSYIGVFAISGPPKKTNNHKANNTWPANVTNVEEDKNNIIPDIEEVDTIPQKSPGFDIMIAIAGILLCVCTIKKRR